MALSVSVRSPESSQTTETQKAAAKPESLKSDSLFMGDVFWGRYMHQWAMASPLKTAYPFSRLHEFNRDDYDAWIMNLECPMVAGFSQTPTQEETTLSFNCSPDYLPEAAKWFTAVSLANNHTDNRGVDGFTETKQHLEDHKIQYFGHYDYDNLTDVCEVISLPTQVTYDDNSVKKESLPVALCGYEGVFGIPTQSALAVMERYAKVMPVIAMPHMGVEYQATADKLKTNTYRSMIDHGADMVLGGHPHWVQNTESYKGHLIVYSMGNFIFDQQGNSELTRSASIHVKLTSQPTDASVLEKWLAIGESCQAFKDDCLTKIEDQALPKLSLNYQFGVVGGNSADKITKLATTDELNSILSRLQWTQTVSQLQSPYSSL